MRFRRQGGVFMHVTSLPGPHGIGDLGAGARDFLDFLDRANQSLWQFCPLGPISQAHGSSPYQSFSAFAGNPLLVSLERLADEGLLTDDELEGESFDDHAVDYDHVASFKRDRLRTAFERFDPGDEYAAFCDREAEWLDGYALFMALKHEFEGALWTTWPHEVKTRDPDALDRYRDELSNEIAYQKFAQFVFDRQWKDLRAYADERDIALVGDLPIYVALDSADVWAAPEAFQLDENNEPTVVAGVPPQGDDGQRWGNPLYDWDHLREQDYDWWMARLDRLFDLVDITRIDHFKGFDEFWAIPVESDWPGDGEWVDAPGHDFFETVERKFGDLPFIVEDLGFLDESVVELRDRFEFPGMRVPQYADWCQAGHMYQPMHYPDNVVGYTSTHDTDTVVGYYNDLGQEQRDCLHYNLGADGSEIEWSIIEAVWNSEAVMAFTTMQDLLGLDSHARFNTPGTAEGNWRWRVTREGFADDIADELASLTDIYIR